MHTLVLGFGLGFVIALQIGPMSLWLVRSTLKSGLGVGLAIGAGIAVVDAGYAAAGAAGAAPLLTIGPLETVLGLIGATVMAVLGARTLAAAFKAHEQQATHHAATVRRAFVTSLAGTASNPLTIASWAAVFTAASTAGAASGASVAVLLAGVGIGSMTWMAILATGVSLSRRWVGDRLLRTVDVAAGSGLVAFGGLLAYRSIRE
jgi:putative LysE/RhtB family amino acid efflux pump